MSQQHVIKTQIERFYAREGEGKRAGASAGGGREEK
jgi:hypothetical protein